jgi:LuxR family maltose regulon positive regulatory protein
MENRGDAEPLLLGDIEMKVLEAVCRYRSLDKEGALKALGEAYRLAAPARLFMPFAELGKDMRTLAETARKEETAGGGLPALWLEDIHRKAAVYAKKL